jgi:hypothetical protein
MSRFSKFALLVLVAALALPMGVWAQEDLTETYDSGALSFKYPSGWVVEGFGGFVLLANSQEAADAPNDALVAGQVQIQFLATGDVSFFADDFIDVSDGIQIEEIVESIGSSLSGQGSIGEPKPVEVAYAPEAYLLEGTDSNGNDVKLFVALSEESIILAFLNATPGGAAEFADTFAAIVQTISFDPDAQPIIGGDAPPAAPAAPVAPTAGEGAVVWTQQTLLSYDDTVNNFGSLGAVAVAADGTVYVEDDYNGIRVFSPEGVFTRTIPNNDFRTYNDIEVAADGTIWASRGFDQKMYQLDTEGNILFQFGEIGTEEGEFGQFSPDVFEIASDGSLVVFDSQEKPDGSGSFGRIQIFTPQGEFVRSFLTEPTPDDGIDDLNSFVNMAIGPDDRLYIAGFFAPIYIFDLEGNILDTTFGEAALGFNSIDDLVIIDELVIGADNSVYVLGSGIITQLDQTGTPIVQFGTLQPYPEGGTPAPEMGSGEFSTFQGAALAPDGGLIVASTNYAFSKVVKLNLAQ